ncbi:hypothetical protein [Fodinicola feengrottensis]|uniref:hypothetical protein n=1 Tax=Fodinicola feengrottensis TaxID=435914 RepID=UPI00244231A8|nr:hypothetical protein [Fodinicola feengrottensis]
MSYQPSPVDSEVGAERLFFPVDTPAKSGTARLWCHIYWRQVLLLQSRLIQAEVASSSILAPHAITSTVDYRLADPDDAIYQPRQPEHAASVTIGQEGGTHVLRVMATDGRDLLRAEATLGEGQLGNQIQLARSALRRVAWGGSEEPWQPGQDYRYERPPSLEQVTSDLILLAVNGYRLHHLLLQALGRGVGADPVRRRGPGREKRLRSPGFVQIALTRSAGHVVPAAMLYDLPLDSNAANLSLCADFVASAEKGELFGSACLTGTCKQASEPDPRLVCPGGFWGFRHALGIPLSIGGGPAVPMTLPYRDGVALAGGVYQDFPSAQGHVEALRGLVRWRDYRMGRDRLGTLEALGEQAQIVYFYCHGGVEGDVPYLRGAGRR